MDRHNNLNLIRLLAALQVVYQHAYRWIGMPVLPDWLQGLVWSFPGVAVFFIVSGFLIAGSLLKEEQTLVQYAAARAMRIYPALWVNLLFLIVLIGVVNGYLRGPDTLQFWQWTAVAFVSGSNGIADQVFPPGIFQSGFYQSFPSGVLWTMPIEIAFYWLAPVIFARPLRDRGLLTFSLAGWFAASFLLFVILPQTYSRNIADFLWLFLIGSALRVYWPKIRWMIEGRAIYWLIGYTTYALLHLAIMGKGHDYITFHPFTFGLTLAMAGTIMACAFTWKGVGDRLLGEIDISYGLYLWHMPVMWTVIAFHQEKEPWALPVVWTLPLLIGLASWLVVEAPALRAKARIVRAGRDRVPA